LTLQGKTNTQHYVTNGLGQADSSPLCCYSTYHPIREGQGFILVYSIASRSTFDRLEIFRQSMMRVKRSRPIFMLVGNKSDKFTEREVSKEEGFQMAQSYGCEFMETSAKTSQNVENLFTHLIRSLRTTLPDPISPRSLATRDSHQGRGEKKKKKGISCIIV